VTEIRGPLSGPALFSLVEFEARSSVPLTVPPGFPVLSTGLVSVKLKWQRGGSLDIELLDLPELRFGPLRMSLERLQAERRRVAAADLLRLQLKGRASIELPGLADRLALAVDSIDAIWRPRGARALTIRDATTRIPPEAPLLGGIDCAMKLLEVTSAGPGAPVGFDATFELGAIDPPLTDGRVPGVVLAAPHGLRLRLAQAATAAWPVIELVQDPPEDSPGDSTGPLRPLILTLPLLELQVESGELSSTQFRLKGSATPRVDLEFLSIRDLRGEVEVSRTGWRGHLLARAVSIDLFDRAVTFEDVGVTVRHGDTSDELDVELGTFDLSRLGVATGIRLEQARFSIRRSAGDNAEQTDVHIAGKASFGELAALLGATLPAGLQLPTSGSADVRIDWVRRETGPQPETRFRLRAAIAIENVDRLWAFVPERQRPQVASADFSAMAELVDGQFQEVVLNADLSLRLPRLEEIQGLAERVRIDTGDEERLVRASLIAEAVEGAAAFRLVLADPLSIGLFCPGLQSPDPSLHVHVDSLSIAAGDGSAASGAAVRMEATFRLTPPDPPPFIPLGAHVRKLIQSTGVESLEGTATIELAVDDEGEWSFELVGAFQHLGIELDVFELLADLARGSAPASIGGTEVPLKAEVAFRLKGVGMRLGKPIARQGETIRAGASRAALWLETEFRFGDIADGGADGQPAVARLELSEQELALVVPRLRVPLSMPLFPFSGGDLQVHDDPAGPRDFSNPDDWSEFRTTLETELASHEAAVETAEARIREIEESLGSEPTEVLRLELTELVAGRRGREDEVLAIRQRLAILGAIHGYWARVDEAGRTSFVSNCRLCLDLIRAASSPFHFPSPIFLDLRDVGFSFPFNQPSAARLDGAVSFTGFPEGSLLGEVASKLALGLGLSADQVFFTLKTNSVIQIPKIGPYEGGAIEGRFSFGYGYTRNSVAISANGNIVLPAQLVGDIDTSQRLGAGVRLPTHNRCGFRLDLIVVSISGVEFVVPVVDFELDLRAPYSPPFTDISRCVPYWDGFQVHVPGLLRVGLKHLAMNYFLGVLPFHNSRYDFDLAIGDERNGLRMIVNDFWDFGAGYFYYSAMTYGVAIPLLAAMAQPFFDNVAVALSVAGFEVQFDLERPVPTFSPLALFEVLALLADPGFEIDESGHLANTVRVSLRHARIRIPRELHPLFPGADSLEKPLDITLNLGTLIQLMQQMYRAMRPTTLAIAGGATTAKEWLERILPRSPQDARRWFEEVIAAHPPKINPGALLALLPPELRKVRVAAALGGFEAGAVIVLIGPEDARGEMARRDPPAPQGSARRVEFHVGQPLDVEDLLALLPEVPGDHRRHFGPGEWTCVLQGLEFKDFDASAFDDLPATPEGAAATVIGAHVTLPLGQRVRFVGCVYDDGSFALVSRSDPEPLRLAITGLDARMPLAFHGRLTLTGRARRYGTRARVSAEASVHWSVLPRRGLAELHVDRARLTLDGTGSFSVAGAGRLSLFDGLMALTGRAEVTESFAMFEGRASMSIGSGVDERPVLELAITAPAEPGVADGARCLLGPGNRIALSGRGTLAVLGQDAVPASFEVSERRVTVDAELRSFGFRFLAFDEFVLRLRGEIDPWRVGGPGFLLEGAARWRLGDLLLVGRGGVGNLGGTIACFGEGELTWQRCAWLQGRVDLRPDGMTLSGATEFTIDFLPSELPFLQGLPSVVGLVVRVGLAGRFDLTAPNDASGGVALHKAEIDGSVTLALRLPNAGGIAGGGRDQLLPVAIQRFGGKLDASAPLTLLGLREVATLPFASALSVSIPTLELETPALSVWSRKRMSGDQTAYDWWIKPLPEPPLPSSWSAPDGWREAILGPLNLDAREPSPIQVPSTIQAGVVLSLCWQNGGLALQFRQCADDEGSSIVRTFDLASKIPLDPWSWRAQRP
jgi:hypothetical protein